MRLILREKKKLGEIKKGNYGDVFVTLAPETFLQLTLPRDDYELVERFINETKAIKDPEQLVAKAKELKAETDEDLMSIGKDVMLRGAFYFKKSGGFKPELAGRLGLAVQFKGQPVVTSHGGRARSLIAALSGVKEVDASIIFYDMDVDQFITDPACKQIQSQDFREGGVSQVNRDKIKIVD